MLHFFVGFVNGQNFNDVKVDDVAYLYLFREYNFNGSIVKYKIKDAKKIICKLGNNKYFVHELKTGIHLIYVKNYFTNAKKQ